MNINRRGDVYIASSLFCVVQVCGRMGQTFRRWSLEVTAVNQTFAVTIYNFVQVYTTMHNPVQFF